jgi:diguanylate cyclase (GGDEF)-like protein
VPDAAWHSDLGQIDRELDQLVGESRTRMLRRLEPRDRAVSVAMGTAMLVTAVAMAALIPWGRSPTLLQALLLVCTLTAFSRVQFEIGAGVALPTQLALVPMMFILPAATLPAAAAAGYLLSALIDCASGRLHPERMFVVLGSTWHAVGPAVVLLAAGEPTPSLDDWPVYGAALIAQFGFDLGSALVRDTLALGVSPRVLIPCLSWVYAVDGILFPVGLVAAFATAEDPYAFVLLLPLAGLFALFARERRARLDRVLELAGAYHTANKEARRDALTGVGNRLAWEEAVAAEEARRTDTDAPASLVLIDLDGLKATNDAYGHEVGDGLLRSLAALIEQSVREGDVLARIGGDEFAVLLSGSDEDACAKVVSRLRQAIEQHEGLAGRRLSAAIGNASCPPAGSLIEAQSTADERLYRDKPPATIVRSA